MAVLPRTIREQIAFGESHVAAWREHAQELGLGEQRAVVFAQQLAATRAAYDAALAAREAAEAATTALYGQARELQEQAALIVREIKTRAAASDEPESIYALGRIPLRAAASPRGAPGRATNIEIDLVAGGGVKLSWTADDAAASSGAFFEVLRKLPGETTYMSIGASEGTTSRVRVMSFVDSTIPATAAGLGVAYIIVPRRGAMRGEMSEAIAVQVGTRVGAAVVRIAA